MRDAFDMLALRLNEQLNLIAVFENTWQINILHRIASRTVLILVWVHMFGRYVIFPSGSRLLHRSVRPVAYRGYLFPE